MNEYEPPVTDETEEITENYNLSENYSPINYRFQQIEPPVKARLPEKYRPISAWGYLGYQILFMIPLVGFICAIIFSLSNENINRRNFARSYFCVYLIAAIIIAVMMLIILAGTSIIA